MRSMARIRGDKARYDLGRVVNANMSSTREVAVDLGFPSREGIDTGRRIIAWLSRRNGNDNTTENKKLTPSSDGDALTSIRLESLGDHVTLVSVLVVRILLLTKL
jgi:hypothetical protein